MNDDPTQQLKCLRDAQRRVNPMNEFYWEEVAKYVPGKNARQCQEKIEQQFSSRREGTILLLLYLCLLTFSLICVCCSEKDSQKATNESNFSNQH